VLDKRVLPLDAPNVAYVLQMVHDRTWHPSNFLPILSDNERRPGTALDLVAPVFWTKR
jgi:hypothetical protein